MMHIKCVCFAKCYKLCLRFAKLHDVFYRRQYVIGEAGADGNLKETPVAFRAADEKDEDGRVYVNNNVEP